MANICAHCGKGFTCGCQKLRAADGNIIHKACAGAYKPKKENYQPDSLTQKIQKAQNNIVRR